jgi:hypothetical protein
MLQDVAVLLTVSRSDGPRLRAGMAALRAARSDLQVVILADEDVPADVLAGLDRVQDGPVIVVDNVPDGKETLDWSAVTRSVSAPVITAIPLTEVQSSTVVRRVLDGAAADAP